MEKVATVIAILILGTQGEKLRFDNYTVYRLTLQTDQQISLLNTIRFANDTDNTPWDNLIDNDFDDLIVPPNQTHQFESMMAQFGIPFEVITQNVQELIDKENPPIKKVSYDFISSYHTLEEIYEYMDRLKEKYPDKVVSVLGGWTHENRPISGVKLFPGSDKPRIFIEGGMHAREWIGTATVIFLIDHLLHSKRPEVVAMTKEYEFYLFPSCNPDGYVYSHKVNRFWRKTRRPLGRCQGVDPNRNFGYKWNVVGGSSRPCSEIYVGREPFSEIETRTLSDYIESLREGLFAYISFHSYSQLLMFPYGFTKQHLDNYDESLAIATKAVTHLSKRYGTKYNIGNIAETIYPATGSSVDWVKSHLKLPLVFVYELRDNGQHGFLLPSDQIIPTGLEVTDSLIALFDEAKKYGYPKKPLASCG